MTNKGFNEQELLHALKHYLPSQTPLKDFIHHNSLHAFQKMKFYDAIFKASAIFGYQVTLPLTDFRTLYKIGRIKESILEKIIRDRKRSNLENWKDKVLFKTYNEHNDYRIGKLRANWKKIYKIDLDTAVQPLLFRILASYLDQGVSVWQFPEHASGLIAALQEIERNNYISIFKTSRARKLLLQPDVSITQLLNIIVGKEEYFNQYIFDQQFSHRGWSGMVSTLEDKPASLLDPKKISLNDLLVFELILEIDCLEHETKGNWQPLASTVTESPVDLFEDPQETELSEILKIWQDAFEWSYYDEVLAAMQKLNTQNRSKETSAPVTKSFQAIFCIDERECSLRRHIESLDKQCETFGCPGFFGVEFYFQAEHAKFYDKLCPAPVTPSYLIKEYDVSEKRKHDLLYTKKTHQLITGFISAVTFGFWAVIRLVQNLFSPKMSPAISNAFAHMNEQGKLTIENKDINDKENGLQIGFTIEEMATRVMGVLNGIGLTSGFAPLIYIVAHGSSSANNPHHGAHDCGACSGRPGSVNARVFAAMANHKEVRKLLTERGITIPDTCQFIGALHDTAADQIEFYDVTELNAVNAAAHKINYSIFDNALDLNAKERSRRFASIDTSDDLKKIRKAIKDRSVSLFEPRPELGHGTNTLCIVGKRELTKGLFLDRRAFLNSYSYQLDPEGKFLTGVMRPLGPVCGGINLEYYFSRVDNYKLGAGTKLPHNVVGLIGVTNSSDGDLRPGLPWQMIEVHDPLRLMIIVEHYPEVVLKTIQSVPEMYEWFINEWVHLVSIHPESKKTYYFNNGEFTLYEPEVKEVRIYKDVNTLLETAKEMETNHISDATQENLPVYLQSEI